jgi:hypothetical protein
MEALCTLIDFDMKKNLPVQATIHTKIDPPDLRCITNTFLNPMLESAYIRYKAKNINL